MRIKKPRCAGCSRMLSSTRSSMPERLRGVDIDGWRLADLAALPVMTKHDMMGAFDSVLTDPSVTKERADDHLAAHGQSLAYLDGRYLVITSGGSSGERGVFVWGVEAFTAYALSSVRRTMAKLASFGVTRDNPVSGALVAAGSPMHATAIIGQLMGGPGAAVNMSAIPATLPFEEIVHRLQRRATVVPRRLPLRARASRRRASIGSVVHRAAGGQRDQRTAADTDAPFDRGGVRCADHQHVRFERRTVRRERGGERRDLLRRGHLHRRTRRRRQPSRRAGRGSPTRCS